MGKQRLIVEHDVLLQNVRQKERTDGQAGLQGNILKLTRQVLLRDLPNSQMVINGGILLDRSRRPRQRVLKVRLDKRDFSQNPQPGQSFVHSIHQKRKENDARQFFLLSDGGQRKCSAYWGAWEAT